MSSLPQFPFPVSSIEEINGAQLLLFLSGQPAPSPFHGNFFDGAEVLGALCRWQHSRRSSRRLRKGESRWLTITLDYLGENVSTLDEASGSRSVYMRCLNELENRRIRGNVSLKLTQFGMDLSEEACRDNVRELVSTAAKFGNFVRVDMESSEYTDRTLETRPRPSWRIRRMRRCDPGLPSSKRKRHR